MVVATLGGVPNVGRVAKIGVRAVSVITRDGKTHLIPNELLMTQAVENWSYSSREVRVRMRVPVAYDSDIRLAQRILLDTAKANLRILGPPRSEARRVGKECASKCRTRGAPGLKTKKKSRR